jgi:hypothetical protein
MAIKLHPHAFERIEERGTTVEEVVATVEGGESFPAKFGRIGFRRNFPFSKEWRGRVFASKQLEVFAVKEEEGWREL